MAVRLADASAPGEGEVRDAAAAVRRYFAEALPLHMADEDEDLAPRLAGRDPEVDAALTALSREHVEHAEDVGRLVVLCAELERDPHRHAQLGPELSPLAHRLSTHLHAHLEREERVVFPALRRLPQPELDALRDRVRARRAQGLRDP
jgi:iron-sulfur cluster repair protein YtfE (RIC family)